ncbi:helix-turn-helix domain-containing protein [Amedibacillus dolichus]|uniref:helix-turn-helix transcriptional regulator n=1 Tax=Amedibacillus dolichus TaxID=31971 RepID=UPI001D020CAE|nr:helix-turn-helix transcriptional regulator [Amedibacillus dolichus]MCB5373986.1 helix-turn-helix domain-containing protein [Amedibacillus dolichus]
MEEIDSKVVGQRLIELRGTKTQEIVSKALGITPQALSNYELGLRIPRDSLKKKIALYYNKTVQEIFFD